MLMMAVERSSVQEWVELEAQLPYPRSSALTPHLRTSNRHQVRGMPFDRSQMNIVYLHRYPLVL